MDLMSVLGLGFSCCPDAMLVTDTKGRILARNQAAENLRDPERGHEPPKSEAPCLCAWLRCVHLPNGSPPGDACHTCRITDDLQLKKGRALRLTCQNQNGEHWVAEVTGVPLPEIDGCPPSLLILVRDISRHIQLRRHFEQQVQQWREQAVTDALTGLGNRFRLQEEWRRVGKATVCMLDVDNMKDINDGCGHDVGDKVLQQIANLLRRYTRQTDLAIRYGGDEFLLLLPHTTLSQAQGLMKRLGRLMAGLNEFLGIDVDISFSYGLAELNPGDRLEDILVKADRAMYRHKMRRGARSLHVQPLKKRETVPSP